MQPKSTPKTVQRTENTTIALLMGVYIVDYVDRVMIATALPLIGAEFGLNRTEQGLVVSAFAIAYMAGQFPAGLLADRIGSRRLLVISLAAWSAFTAATSLAPGLVALLVLRALFGISQALFPTASFKTLTERTRPGARSRSAGLMIASNNLGAGLGPLIVAPVVVMTGWRHTFWIIAAAGLVVGLLLWRLMPPPLPRELTVSGTEELDSAAPVRAVLRNGLVLRCALMFACYNMLTYGMITWVPSYLMEARGMSMVQAGVSSAVPPLVAAFAVALGGQLMSRGLDTDPRRLVVPALLVSAALLVAMLLTDSTTAFTVLQSLAMFSAGLSSIGIIGMPLRALPRDVVGSGMGLVNTGGQLAGVLAPLVMGWLADRSGFPAAFGFLALATAAAACISLTTRPLSPGTSHFSVRPKVPEAS
ncbi:MFS transporter [Streptomyces sp. NPDC048301]|uniref:MFS transporter n=1 Tax=Streptomyces sp. NPDC048301 TaxID=3155631 RepID=UPI003419AC0D